MQRLIFVFVCFLFLIQPVLGATVSGTVYSLYLDVLNGAIVEIDSQPRQVMIADDGDYSFSLEPGDYHLQAYYRNDETYFTEENITITAATGEYVIDLILFPDLSDDDLDDIEGILDFPDDEDSPSSFFPWIIAGLFIVIGAFFAVRVKRSRRPSDHTEGEILSEPQEDLQQLLSYLKDHDGRATQKELRKQFSWSESKISLMLSELEDGGQVKKIKRGRSNIVILQKS